MNVILSSLSDFVMPESLHSEKKRLAGVDVGRCFFMLLVVLHHCCYYSVLNKSLSAIVLFVPTLCCVDGFVAISGYFGIKFKWCKVVNLVVQVVFYWFFYIIIAFICWKVLGEVKPKIHSPGYGWFTPCYIALVCISPLINAGLTELTKQGRKSLLQAWGLFSAMIFFHWLVVTLKVGGFVIAGFGSHTFITLLYVYVTVRTMVLAKVKIPSRWLAFVIVVSLLFVWISSYLLRLLNYPHDWYLINTKFGMYDSIFTLSIAISTILLFVRWSPPLWLAKIAKFCTPSIFCVYLMHDANRFGSTLWICKPIAWLSQNTGLPNWMILAGWAMIVFCGMIMVDCLIRRLPLHFIKKAIQRTCF